MGIERPKRSSNGITRRQLFEYGASAALVGAGAAGGVHEVEKMLEPRYFEAYPGRRIRLYGTELPPIPEPQTYAMGSLRGQGSYALTADYLGYRGHVPENLSVSFTDNLAHMWEEKAERHPGVSAETETFGKALVLEYAALRKNRQEGLEENFESYLGKLSGTANEIVGSVGPSALAEIYRFDRKNAEWDSEMLLHLSSRINGRILTAYSMTEIMPAGVEAYEFMLQKAGTEFLLRVPAIGDKYTSFGMFQFTKFALDRRQNRHGGTEYVGAALANQALPPDKRIPDKVEQLLTLRDHAGAAILFNIHNLAIALHKLREEGAGDTVMTRISQMDERTLTQLLATHHHQPTHALDSLIEWAKGGEKPYSVYCRGELHQYAALSGKHFEEIEQSVSNT